MNLAVGIGVGVGLSILYALLRDYLTSRKVKKALAIVEANRKRREEVAKEIARLTEEIKNAKLNYARAKSELNKSRTRLSDGRPE